MAQALSLELAQKTEQGLEINGLILEPVVDNCNGCERVKEFEGEKYCLSYPKPASKWRYGACNFATHLKNGNHKQGNSKINPIKASKRTARKK